MKITTRVSTVIGNMCTISDSELEKYLKEKIQSNKCTITVSPYIINGSVERTGDDLIIATEKITDDIKAAREFFKKHPPLKSMLVCFTTEFIQGEPQILMVREHVNSWLSIEDTRKLCLSLGWIFYEPIEVESADDYMVLTLQCVDKYLKVIGWKENKPYKLYSSDIGAVLALLIPSYYKNLIAETNKSMLWYWLLNQSWFCELEETVTTTLDLYIGKMWGILEK